MPKPIIPALFLAGLLWVALPAAAEPIAVTTRPVPLNAEAPDQTSTGKLRYRGGIAVRGDDPAFGGLSALGVSADGARMIALTDQGRRFAAHLVYAENGDLAGLRRTHLDTLAGLDGDALKAKSESDAESMSAGVEGEIIVAFERRHRIWRYMPGEVVPEPLPPPDELAAMPQNSGIEALTLLNDGRLLAVTEGLNTAGDAVAWISDIDGWSVMTYAASGGFKVTGAATLAGGDVLVLERRFTLRDGVAARIRRVKAADIAPGARLRPTLVGELRPPLSVDNFEGIDVRQAPDGRTFVYIVSDDNFNAVQRTLLMMFELTE